MTTYSASVATTSGSATGLALAVTAGSYEMRVPQVTISVGTTGTGVVCAGVVNYYTGTASGGSTVAVTPLREGSVAATATAKSGGTALGTQNILAEQGGTGGLNFTYQPPFDTIISPGSTLLVTLTISTAEVQQSLSIVAYFEELRLSWHY
jgi:hypothetical protein